MNQSAPFWDFVASLEQQGTNHPFFQWGQNQNDNTERGEEGHHGHHGASPPPFGPWGWGFPGFGGRGFPHRGPPPHEEPSGQKDKEKEKEGEDDNDNGEGPSGSGSETEGRCGRRGRCGGRKGRHGCGPRGGRGGWEGPGGFGPHGGPHHHHHGGRRGGWGGPWGRGGPFGGGPFNPLAFATNWFDPTATTTAKEDNDFSPEADIFDTEHSFVIHVSLPGAKKEDVGVNWDAEKSELSIAGVIYRPGDEEFLKTLAMDERKVGPFERKVRLGTRANPAQVDADMISAKLEDGVLRVEVPKLNDTGFVEVRKVDVE